MFAFQVEEVIKTVWGGEKLVHLLMAEVIYAVITAGYREKCTFHVRPLL